MVLQTEEISCFIKTLKRVFFRSFYTKFISRCDRRWHNSMW